MRTTVSTPNLKKKAAAGCSKTVSPGHAAKTPGSLSESTGNSWHPYFQGETQDNPIRFDHWS